ncbi:MAG: FtsQ-type POTRA domain-containing protein [Candidatus Caenarcaniphilales bacterium]|nr:FtsQ-type POTRA domain-containing protein [Candidatus Caenarcaniphilales bacterium]
MSKIQGSNSKSSIDNKNKIVDLWHHRRNQIKQRNKRNFLRRIGLTLIFLLINISLLFFLFKLSSQDLISSIKIKGLRRIKSESVIKTMFLDPEETAWLLKINKTLLEKRLKRYNPLIDNLELKTVLFSSEPALRVYVKEELPWVRFANGWLLTSSGRLIKETEYINFDQQTFASKTLIFSNANEFNFWSSKGRDIQKLIYSVNSQFPELELKSIDLKKDLPIKLHFVPSVVISLGYWDKNILDRAYKLSSTNSILKKYLNEQPTLDLNTGSKAILRIQKKSLKKIKKRNK